MRHKENRLANHGAQRPRAADAVHDGASGLESPVSPKGEGGPELVASGTVDYDTA